MSFFNLRPVASRLTKLGRTGLVAALSISLALTSGPVLAWKPVTHVILGEHAVNDALDDGRVGFFNRTTGQYFTYPVAPAVLAALREHRDAYRAGVLGPDAYPDILTGQNYIHPENGTTSAWLGHIWSGFASEGAELAFKLGFMTHAAGDVFGHTFINTFSGGEFTFTDPVDNAIKHVIVEGYVNLRMPRDHMPADFWDASIDGIQETIYRVMIYGRPGTFLGETLLQPEEGSLPSLLSVPYIFSNLRNNLIEQISAYDNQYSTIALEEQRLRDQRAATERAAAAEQQRLEDDCSGFFASIGCWFSDAAASFTSALSDIAGAIETVVGKAARLVVGGITYLSVNYSRAWEQDIADGLRAWPDTSHEIALALFYNPDEKADIDRALNAFTSYRNDHLLSMAGAPDMIGGVLSFMARISEYLSFMPDLLADLKRATLEFVMRQALGVTMAELKSYLTAPFLHFDTVVNRGEGRNVTLQQFNQDFLHLSAAGYEDCWVVNDHPACREKLVIDNVPALYNSVVMSRLILLGPDQINQLIWDMSGRNADRSLLTQQHSAELTRIRGLSNIRLAEESGLQVHVPGGTLARLQTAQNADRARRLLGQLAAERLGLPPTTNQANVMLGWVGSLDSHGQWRDDFVLARNCDVYNNIFMTQPHPPSTPNLPVDHEDFEDEYTCEIPVQ